VTVGVSEIPVAGNIALVGTRPNPFASRTSVWFTLPRAADVRLEVFDLAGRRVARQEYGEQSAGLSHVVFAAGDLKSGLYLYRLQVAEVGGRETSLAGRMLLTR
jgi:hypothetical protein